MVRPSEKGLEPERSPLLSLALRVILGFPVSSAHASQCVWSTLQPLTGCLSPTSIVTGTEGCRGAKKGVWSLVSGGDKILGF